VHKGAHATCGVVVKRLERIFIAVLVAMAVTAGVAISASADTVSGVLVDYGMTNILANGQTLRPGQYLSSQNGMYELRLQADGNLVIYQVTSSTRPIWSTGTNGAGSNVYLGVQGDGNLVLYAMTEGIPQAIWASGSNRPADLYMQNDGNLVMYASGHSPAWASGTASDEKPTMCDPVAPILLGAIYDVKTPQRPLQIYGTTIHGVSTVSSYSMPCGSWIQSKVQRKVCNWTGCNWLDRAVSPKARANQRGYTFATVDSSCQRGTNRYRIETVVYQIHVGDDGTGIFTVKYSAEPEFTC
jgi:hypothetical protein